MIWLATMAGLLPIGLLSVWALTAQASFARLQRGSPELGSLSRTHGISMRIGSAAKFRLTTETWPAVVTLCGIVFVLVGMFFLLPGKPQRFHRDGLSKIGYYVGRVLRSRKDYASVVIAKPGGGHAILIARRGGTVLLNVILAPNAAEAQNARNSIGNFLAKRGVVGGSEFSPNEGEQPANPCRIGFILNTNQNLNAKLIRDLFVEFFGVDDSTGLEFTTTGC